MVFKKLLNSLFVVGVIFFTFFQPSFATNYEDEQGQRCSLAKALDIAYRGLFWGAPHIDEFDGQAIQGEVTSLPDTSSQANDLEGKSSSQTTRTEICNPDSRGDIKDPFFKIIPDDIASIIFSRLNKTKALRSIALTCKRGYQLIQAPGCWNMKQIFAHLPEEYISTLIKDKNERGSYLAQCLMLELLTYQAAEINRLNAILSAWSCPLTKDFITQGPVLSIEEDTKNAWLERLTKLKKSNKNKSCLEIYFSQETALNSINFEIIEACLSLPKTIEIRKLKKTVDGVVMEYHKKLINLCG